jgi:hypothetical protein
MKKSLLFVALIAIVSITVSLAQKSKLTIEKRWEKVDELAEKQLPESALKEVEVVLNQAQKEKNSVQVIKAMVYKMRFTLEKEPDKAPELIKDFEAFTEKSTDPAERALLHSMTAELYSQYYQKDQWTINNRTEIRGLVHDDMKEWTKNIYFDKISNHLATSLVNPEVLQKTEALKYATLIVRGTDSRTLQPTLYDFLAYRRIEMLKELSNATTVKNMLIESGFFDDAVHFSHMKLDTVYNKSLENQIIETYQSLLAFRVSKDNTAALLYADMERLKFIKDNTQLANSDPLYLAALNNLINQYSNDEAVVEVLTSKANYYFEKQYDNKLYKRIAYDICEDGIKRFPKYKRIDLLKNIQRNIHQQVVNVVSGMLAKPASLLTLKIKSTNVCELTLKVYCVNATAYEYSVFSHKHQYPKALFPDKTLVETKHIDIKDDENFEEVETRYDYKTLGYGIYEYTLEQKGKNKPDEVAKGSFTVTDFSLISRANNPELGNLYVLDRVSGQPQAAVKATLYEARWTGSGYEMKKVDELNSDKNGLCTFSRASNYERRSFILERGKDCYYSSDFHTIYNSNNENNDETIQFSIFTDRSLYRPGQIVYFKGIGYYSNWQKQYVALGETYIPKQKPTDIHLPQLQKTFSYDVDLYDANNQKISTEHITSNEFGSFAGKFVLPEGGLNGTYRIQVGEYSQFIQVEEYKRPTFEINIAKPKAEVSFGSKVVIEGNAKAYAGYAVGNADVKFRVVRRPHRYCWWFQSPEVEIINGTTKSNQDGSFDITFIPQKQKDDVIPYLGQIYTYTVYADVTDTKGETQKGEQSVSVGDNSLLIITEIPEKLNKAKKTFIAVSTETINDEKVNSVVKYSLYKLAETTVYDENIEEGKDLKIMEQVLSGNLNTKDQKLELDLSSFVSGRYKLLLSTLDTHGKEVKLEKIVILYGDDDKRPPVNSYVWLLTPKTNCAVDEIAKIKFGTSTLNAAVLYEVMQGNKVLESRWIAFSNEIRTFEIPFLESYGAGITVMFTFMKDEQLFTRSVQITRRVEEKKLTPTLSVFRNKLLPGEKAQWTISIPESAKSKKATELLVEMYDASLDAIRPHSWNFNPTYRDILYNSPQWITAVNQSSMDNAFSNEANSDVYQFQLDKLYWFGLSLGDGNYVGGFGPMSFRRKGLFRKGASLMSIARVVGSDDVNGKDIADLKEVVSQVAEDINYRVVETGVQKLEVSKKAPVQLRTNFNEMAFFYPQLRTDAEGNVKFTFTAPESLTRWNVKMLAHTQDLYFGQGEAQVITQKDLMVQMNLPRFVRRSDKLVLSASVINLTDKAITANVDFELIDPATNQSIPLKNKVCKLASKDGNQISPLGVGGLLLAANETKAVEWELTEFSPYELVICKVVARAGNFSDGEQKYLPVLPDKVLVTESMPLTIRGNQTLTFNFESLLKNGSKVDTKNLSVEFSSNPAWYAVQALPTISTPEDDNALDYFTAYYANSLAAFIANSNPKIAATFDRWKKAGGSRDALMSNLEKNKELKNMLLEETPWVLAAKDETEQKRQIALLFDRNMQKNQAQQYLDKLISLQMPSGGFSWFKGMGESRYITQEIVLNLGRLRKIVGEKVLASYSLPLTSALNYLDLEIAHDFDNLKKYNKDYEKEMSIDNLQLFYLHLRSEYPEIPVQTSAQTAVKFYTAQSEKYWTNLTLYGKAMMAVVANRNGRTQLANDILKSLKENALKTDEFGMYWAKNTAGYFWNERPIGVQSAIIEAFTEISKNTADVDELKIWLLKQKQTQCWDSPMATVDAIYALLYQGSDWLANEGSVKIKLGNMLLQPASAETGTGYFKETIPVANIRPEMGKVTVEKSDKSIGWGAMYWQYYQDLEKIQGQSGALKITKKLFVEKMTSTGKTMLPIEQAKLVKGDKVITRLVITTDRNLEFVALKDLRASCFEPVNQLSGCDWKEGVCYYQTTKDASTQYFFSYLPKGTYVFEYELWANASGEYTSGIASLQCQYAPEFVSHTGGERVKIQ